MRFKKNHCIRNKTSCSLCFKPALFLLVLSISLMHTGYVYAQHRDVPFVPTPYETVEEMLNLAGVGPGDYVIDLGSGDGRIVIAAGRRGAFGHGVDIDPKRINDARRNAARANVDDKVMFVEGNLFETDFSKATVITMYLLNSVNMRLRPLMLEKLKPGTRIVSYYFNMNDWEPDKQVVVNNSDVYYWVVPAKAGGSWAWNNNNQDFEMQIEQEFQKIKPEVTADNIQLQVIEPSLMGDRIWFIAENPDDKITYVFHGRIEGELISGTVQIRSGERNFVETWTARKN